MTKNQFKCPLEGCTNTNLFTAPHKNITKMLLRLKFECPHDACDVVMAYGERFKDHVNEDCQFR